MNICECGCGQPAKNRFKQGHNSKRIHIVKPEIRFWKYVDIPDDPDACWEWLGVTSSNGYGRFGEGPDSMAHRTSYIMHISDIPPEKEIHHRCNNQLCVNPNHLKAVTRIENMSYVEPWQMRRNSGLHKTSTKLDPQKARAIRFVADLLSVKDLSCIYNVHPTVIRNVLNRHSYKYVV
jgi:hypothetical protein